MALPIPPQAVAALDRFVAWVDAGNRRMAWGQDYISNWYQNAAGRVVTIWPYTNVEYWAVTEAIADGDYTFTKVAAPEPVATGV